MAFDFRLPDIGEGVAEGEVVQWFVQEGDPIQEDAPLVSVLTDKANVEIPSPRKGRIAKIHAQVGEKVKVGGLLVTIDTEGGPAPTAAPPSPPSKKTPAGPPQQPPAAPSAASATSVPGTVSASPYVRRLAAEKGIDLSKIRGSGPGGRITEADVAGGATSPPSTPAVSEASPGPAPPPSTSAARPSGEILERIPIRGVRRVIAEHMAESTHKAAPFTYVEEVNVTELVALRERMSKHFEKQGLQLHYLPFIVKAVIAGLRAQPRMNARMDDAQNELVVYGGYHIGIATAAPEGLIVPVVRDADQKSLAQLAREIQDLSDRGRAGKLTRAELSGSTFTITSLGILGGLLATPILNYPEVAILGVHRIFHRPVYRPDGTLAPAALMNFSVTLDHRVLDGIVGAQFLAVVRENLEDPHQLFAGMR